MNYVLSITMVFKIVIIFHQVSQSLVDLQIENNRIMEEAEATKFELTNKVSRK